MYIGDCRECMMCTFGRNLGPLELAESWEERASSRSGSLQYMSLPV